MFLSVESMLRCNGTMEEPTSSKRASIGGSTIGNSPLIAPTPLSLEMPATGGLDAPRLVDSPVLSPSTRVSLVGASSLPRRRRIPMVLWEMKILTWRVVTLKQPVIILFDLILYSILSPSFVETKEYYIYAMYIHTYYLYTHAGC